MNAEQLGLAEGDATFVAKARDWSLWRWLSGNPRRVEVRLIVDLTRPRIAVETGQTYVERGGAGAVVYRVGERTGRDGVQVGDTFFAGRPFPGDPERRIALSSRFRATPPRARAPPCSPRPSRATRPPPAGRSSSASASSTKSAAVTLTLSAADTDGVSRMRFRDGPATPPGV